MKYLTTLFILATCLWEVTALAENQYYVWQQQWGSNVLDAVRAEAATTLYPVATVIPPHGQSKLVALPWKELSVLAHRYVPVIRIPLGAFNRNDIGEELARTTRAIIASAPEANLSEIQFDLDCPERRLSEYTELVRRFRKKFHGLRVSITALPCHLNNRSFQELAKANDYYVLQVHGLNVPQTIHENAELLNIQTAQKALRQADALGHPFCVALPCYAYELHFDAASGAFLCLTAERPTRRQETTKKRICAKPADLLQIQKQFQTLEQGRNIIWFRLPVKGDRLCLPRPTLACIESGSLPAFNVTCETKSISDSTVELRLFNGNIIHAHSAVVQLNWPNPEGAYDVYQHVLPNPMPPGHLPTELTVPLPPPGQSEQIGWFSSQNPETKVLLK